MADPPGAPIDVSTEVLFVNLPPYEASYAERVANLGMLYVLTSLRHHGYTVSYLDCARKIARRGEILSQIRKAEPKLVGFSVDTDNMLSVGSLTHELKLEFGESLPIVLGGPASEGDADTIMEQTAADVLVVGEGEYTMREVADCLLRGQGRLEDIAGIRYRTPQGVVETEPRAPIEDLDSLPFPDRDLLYKPARYQPTIISGRGCPFQCTFCFEGRKGNHYRHRSPENIVDEIEYLLSLGTGPRFVQILDDTLTADPEHVGRLCRLMKERFTPWEDLLWFCEVRVDVVARNLWLVEELVEAGVGRIQIGAESADLDVLKAYKRLNVTPDVVEEVVSAFHQAGVPSMYVGFILGGPHETMETLERTLDFAKHLLIDVAPGTVEAQATFLTPLPGTELRTRPEHYGLRLLDPDLLTSSNFNFCITESETLSREDINNFRWRFAKEIDECIRTLIPELPRSVIERHWRMKELFAMTSAYEKRFVFFPRLPEYLSIVGEGKYEPASALSNEEILARFPTRLSLPVRMNGKLITVLEGPKDLDLNETGSQIFALCSGKLKTSEIADVLRSSFDGGAPALEEVRADVIEIIRHLDENYAVFLKDY